MDIKNSILTRIRIALFAIGLVAVLVLIKIGNVQFVEADKWLSIAKENGLKFRTVKATRGNVLSDNGTFLATSLPFYKLAIDPTVAHEDTFNNNLDTLSSLLADYFQEKPKEEYLAELQEARLTRDRYYVVSRKKLVSYQERKILKNWPLFREGRYRGGVLFEKVDKRFRPYDPIGRRTIGFLIDSDSTEELKGRGLEYSFNADLAGVDGEALYQRIAGGRWKPVEDESMVKTENGFDVQTTINIDFQERATNILESSLRRHAANYGVLILMEVETGEIKAMVNLGRNSKGNYTENYNYAVGNQGVTEPGSTFKTASMMAILEATDVDTSDVINTEEGQYMFYDDCIMTDAAVYGYGNLDVKSVFEKSSNIGVSKMAFRHFQDKPMAFYNYLKKFGLTDPLDFQMVGGGEPQVFKPGDEFWSGCSLPWMSIGYEVKISPLQLLTFYNAIANNGKRIEPLLVKRVLKGGHITVEEFESKVLDEQICSDKTLGILKTMLEGVVERGTAKNIKTEEYKIAGKTGTTHKLYRGKYVDKYYTSFAGYFPADKPKYSCIVVVDEPKTERHYGGDVAAPVFRELADWLFDVGIEQNLDELEYAQGTLPFIQNGKYQDLKKLSSEFGLKSLPMNTEEWVRTDLQGDTILWKDNVVREELMPDVVGMTLKDAIYLLENRGLDVQVIGRGGRVRKQSLGFGRKVRKGDRVFITMG